MEKDFMKRIVVNPKVMVGKPVIRGTRVPVYEIVNRIAEGWTFQEILEDFPRITENDIKAALLYAGMLAEGEEIFPEIINGKHAIPSR
ncbi:DUF433 domain-containing protein [Candidatus Woesearchaeota archaeon]|nr:DUF433 domain-containing protein [Candidatus Woesearchaeota archaeon]